MREDQIELRLASVDDLEFTYRVKKAAEGDLVQAIYGWDEAVQRNYQKNDFVTKRPSLIVVDGRPVGTVALVETGGCLEVGQFFILPEHQNQGIGTCILRRALRLADEKRLPTRLAYLRGNRAEALYRRHGFELTGHTETHRFMERPPGGGCMVNQPAPQVTAADVERIVRRDFPADLVPEVTALLDEYGGEDWHPEPYRVRLAALKLAAGDLDELQRQLDWAKLDYRDVVAAAEYPGYSSRWLGRGGTPDEPPEAVIAADWEQYRGWLAGGTQHD